MVRKILYALVVLSLMQATSLLGHQRSSAPLNQAELNQLLQRTLLTLDDYRTKFKDLGADEHQTVEEYNDRGDLRRQRRIVSDLAIYQSPVNPASMAEYRNVREVDGKAVGKRDERLVDLFKRLTRAGSFQQELERINREGQRYDRRYSLFGLTLNQGLLLSENMHSVFQFTDGGRQRIDGREVIIVQYQQVSQSPDITTEFERLPKMLKGAQAFYRGRLWLDAETAQIWREERELILRHSSLKEPLVLHRFEFEYVNSRFGILTPKRIVWSSFDNGRTTEKGPELGLGGKVILEYSNFTHFEVGRPDASVGRPVKP